MALSTNLKAYYKFDNGALTTDSTANGNTLTNNNTVAGTASGKIGYGADFGSSNTNKKFSIASALVSTDKTTATYSMSCWFYASFTNDKVTYLFEFNQNGKLREEYGIWNFEGVHQVGYLNNGGTGGGDGQDFQSGSITINANTWYHFVATRNGTAVTIYLNGSSVATGTVTVNNGTLASDGFAIAGSLVDSNYHEGLMDEVAIWDKVLTQEEVTELYNSGDGLEYPWSTEYTLDCQTGSFSLTGIDTFITRPIINFICEVADFTLTGIDITTQRAYNFLCNVGQFILTGKDIILSGQGSWKWRNETKHTSTFTNESKNTSTFTNEAKNSSTWNNESKS